MGGDYATYGRRKDKLVRAMGLKQGHRALPRLGIAI